MADSTTQTPVLVASKPSAPPAPAAHGDWAPLRNRVFLALWIASAVSYVGFEVRNYAAPLLMLDFKQQFGVKDSMAAYTQTASTLPIPFLVLIAGALADVLDRRKLLIVTHLWMMAAAAALGLLTISHLMTPWLLLALLFVVGAGFAMANPAFLAVLPELVDPKQLRSALALNSVSLNVARVLGPMIGGLVVVIVGNGSAGKGAAFLVTAVSVVGVVAVLLNWKPAARPKPANPESVWGAVRTGFRYAWFSARLRAILIRVCLFIFCAGVLHPFSAIVGRRALHLGDGAVSLMMACLGVGAIIGVYYMQALQRRIGVEETVVICTALYGSAMLGVALAPSLSLACVAMLVAGFNWVIVPTNFNIATQLAVPAWVKGRAMGMYLLVLWGSMSAGAAVWGKMITIPALGPRGALACAAVGVLLGMVAIIWFRLVPKTHDDFTPAGATAPKPAMSEDPHRRHGPVLVTVEYHIAAASASRFIELMGHVRQRRLRDGASHWGLYDDAAAPGRFLETYTVRSWIDYRRQHQRLTKADQAIEQEAIRLHTGATPPAVSHYVASGRSLAGRNGVDRRASHGAEAATSQPGFWHYLCDEAAKWRRRLSDPSQRGTVRAPARK